MANEFLALNESDTPYVPPYLFAGDSPDVSTLGAKLVSGQNLAQYAVLGRITASGKVKQWDPAAVDGSQNAIGILLYATDASGGDKACTMYVAGCFNIDALSWIGGATTVQKVRAFDGTSIVLKALPGSTTVV